VAARPYQATETGA